MRHLKRFFNRTNIFRLLLAIVLAQAVAYLREEKPPWKTAWARHIAEGKDPSFREHLHTGLWWGAAARAGLTAAVLALSLGWWAKGGSGLGTRTSFDVGTPEDVTVSPRTFWVALGVIVVGAAVMRAPRMNQSFWGDEADAMATYVHGSFQPVKKSEPHGRLSFNQPLWLQTFFSARHGANNHVLFSVASRGCLVLWRKITGAPETAFVEWPTRLPSLLAGVGSLVTLALLLRRWGAPAVGLLATAFMALHPWHVRYSTEARGYALMLLLLPLLLIALTNALEKNRWRDWLAFAACEFLLMYSWGGIVYALALLNVAMLVLIVLRTDKFALLVRWLTANLLSAAVFASLYLPHLPQIASARKRLMWIKGLPMDEAWFHDLLTQPFTGIPFHERNPANASELSWQRFFHEHPVLTTAGFAVILAAFLLGLTVVWRRNKPAALLVTNVFAAAAVCTMHFKFVLGDELRTWYLIFTLPFVSICVGFGLHAVAIFLSKGLRKMPSGAMRSAPAIMLLALASASVWPANASLMRKPEEDYKGAVAAIHASHESRSPEGDTDVRTIWLWRHSAVYAPRGERHVRDAAALRDSMAKARAAEAELYVVVGFRELAMQLNADMLVMLEDPALFEKTASFPSRESLHSLDVYRMRK
jgi:hypothetical protein